MFFFSEKENKLDPFFYALSLSVFHFKELGLIINKILLRCKKKNLFITIEEDASEVAVTFPLSKLFFFKEIKKNFLGKIRKSVAKLPAKCNVFKKKNCLRKHSNNTKTIFGQNLISSRVVLFFIFFTTFMRRGTIF